MEPIAINSAGKKKIANIKAATIEATKPIKISLTTPSININIDFKDK